MLLPPILCTIYATHRTTSLLSAVMVPRYGNAARQRGAARVQDNLPRTCGTVRFPAGVPPPRDPFSLEIPWHPQPAIGAVDRTIRKSRGCRRAVVSKWRFTRRVHLKSGRTPVPPTAAAGSCINPSSLVRAVWATGHFDFSMWMSAQGPCRGASKLDIGLPAGVSEGADENAGDFTMGQKYHLAKVQKVETLTPTHRRVLASLLFFFAFFSFPATPLVNSAALPSLTNEQR